MRGQPAGKARGVERTGRCHQRWVRGKDSLIDMQLIELRMAGASSRSGEPRGAANGKLRVRDVEVFFDLRFREELGILII